KEGKKEAGAEKAEKKPAEKAAKADANVDDATLKTNVIARLQRTPSLKDANIPPEVKGGVVTLNGEVPKPGLKGVATNVVKAVAGVKSVDNQIKVAKTAPEKGPGSEGTPKVN